MLVIIFIVSNFNEGDTIQPIHSIHEGFRYNKNADHKIRVKIFHLNDSIESLPDSCALKHCVFKVRELFYKSRLTCRLNSKSVSTDFKAVSVIRSFRSC